MQRGLSAPDLLLSDPSLASPSQHPHPHLQYRKPLSQDPGQGSGQRDLGVLPLLPNSRALSSLENGRVIRGTR